MRRCGFHSLPEAFSCLNQLEYLDIMDPYQDLRVLQHMPALTWLRVKVYGRFDVRQGLALAFPNALHTLDVECNIQVYCNDGYTRWRCLDQVGSPLACLL